MSVPKVTFKIVALIAVLAASFLPTTPAQALNPGQETNPLIFCGIFDTCAVPKPKPCIDASKKDNLDNTWTGNYKATVALKDDDRKACDDVKLRLSSYILPDDSDSNKNPVLDDTDVATLAKNVTGPETVLEVESAPTCKNVVVILAFAKNNNPTYKQMDDNKLASKSIKRADACAKPTVTATPGECVAKDAKTGVIMITIANPNDYDVEYDVTLNGKKSKEVEVSALDSENVQYSGLAAGTYEIRVSYGPSERSRDERSRKSVTTTVTIAECECPVLPTPVDPLPPVEVQPTPPVETPPVVTPTPAIPTPPVGHVLGATTAPVVASVSTTPAVLPATGASDTQLVSSVIALTASIVAFGAAHFAQRRDFFVSHK
jgi:hypothetical protein